MSDAGINDDEMSVAGGNHPRVHGKDAQITPVCRICAAPGHFGYCAEHCPAVGIEIAGRDQFEHIPSSSSLNRAARNVSRPLICLTPSTVSGLISFRCIFSMR